MAPPANRGFMLGIALVTAACAPMSARLETDAVFPAALTGLGTEPFWSVQLRQTSLHLTTADHSAGWTTTVSRQEIAGRLELVGTLDGKPLHATVRQATCSDGMSERTYPFTLEITVLERKFDGCAYASTVSPGNP